MISPDPENLELCRLREDRMRALVRLVVVLLGAIIILLLLFIVPWGLVREYFHCDRRVWADVGFSLGISIATLFLPMVVSAKVNEYLNFSASEQLVSLKKALYQRVEEVAPESVNSVVVEEVFRREYAAMFDKARRIEVSVNRIGWYGQLIMLCALLIVVVFICRMTAYELGPVILVLVFSPILTHYMSQGFNLRVLFCNVASWKGSSL